MRTELRTLAALALVSGIALAEEAKPAPEAKATEAAKKDNVTLANTPWPMFQHDLQHTGRSLYAGPKTPTLKWEVPFLGPTGNPAPSQPGSPALGPDGTIYVTTGMVTVDTSGFIYAINPDGTQKWRYQPQGLPSSTTPAIAADGTVYVHMNGEEGNIVAIEKLYAMNPDGSVRWIVDFGPAFVNFVQSSPAIGPDGTLYVTSMNTSFYAINPDGTIQWALSPDNSSIVTSPAIGTDGTIYVRAPFELFAYSPGGTLKWQTQINIYSEVGGSPVIAADGTIYVIEQDGVNGQDPVAKLVAVNPDGTIKWRSAVVGTATFESTPSIGADGTVYIGLDGFFAFRPDGTLKWRAAIDGQKSNTAASIGSDGTIYWKAAIGGVVAFNPDGAAKWRLVSDLSPSLGYDPTPVIAADGTLFVTAYHCSDASKVVCQSVLQAYDDAHARSGCGCGSVDSAAGLMLLLGLTSALRRRRLDSPVRREHERRVSP